MSPSEACKKKKVYYSHRSAKRAAKEWTIRNMKKMIYYECECCGFYHLATLKKKKKTYRIPSAGIIFRQ